MSVSIRTALIGGLSVLLLLSSTVLAVVGIRAIRDDVVREAQARVDRDLDLLAALYEGELALLAERLRSEAQYLELDAATLRAVVGADRDETAELDRRLLALRRSLDFAVLGVVGQGGRQIAGATAAPGASPGTGTLLRSALAGEAVHGTVLLGPQELRAEGGQALADRVRLAGPGDGSPGGTDSALFQWFAIPIRDEAGAVRGAVYGGRPLNGDTALVDRFAGTLYGDHVHAGKPVGAVTIFLRDTRIATNVRDHRGERALGTRVSDAVGARVLGAGQPWHDRAWVVDAWYLSGYRPLPDPEGRTIGMLYVGLLEAPYEELRTDAVRRFAVPAVLLLAIAWIAAVVVVERITSPLERLRESASIIADGGWDHPVDIGPSYTELRSLSQALVHMQATIGRRDRQLRGTNAELEETNARLAAANDELGTANARLASTNEELAEANENYRNTLGFVTHELKAPLANMQSHLELVIEGHGGTLSERGRDLLRRVQRNCEELQGMVKDYLDLSRAEQTGFVPRSHALDLLADVVVPAVGLNEEIFRSRDIGIGIEVLPEPGLPPKAAAGDSSEALHPVGAAAGANPGADRGVDPGTGDQAVADPREDGHSIGRVLGDAELLRIALGNLLGNAAKYGREGSRAVLAIQPEQTAVVVTVWNEGAGFAPEEAEQLFSKFSRLHNANTKGKKGSGLGLFIAREVITAHGGEVWAESNPGSWARFGFRIPRGGPPATPPPAAEAARAGSRPD